MKRDKFAIYALGALAALSLPTGVQAQTEETDGTEKVNVAFRTVDKDELASTISYVDMLELSKKSNSTYSLENMGALVSGYSGGLWSMGDAYVVVDGVPRSENNVMPSEIEQITFLKSAAAVALYGSKAAKGAVLITTKRAHQEDLKITATANAHLYTAKSLPKYLGSAEYMSLYNEAFLNDGKTGTLPFSEEQIYNTATGANPYRYPNVDFYSSDYIKKTSSRYDATAEFEGGGKYAHFYTNIGFYSVGDMVNFGEGKNNRQNRLNIRGNIDLRFNDDITGFVNTSASFYDDRHDRSNYWAQAATLRPNRVAPLIPLSYLEENDFVSREMLKNNSSYIINGMFLGGTQLDPTNPFAAMYVGGYDQWTSRNFQFDLGLNFDLHKVLEGLSFKTQFAIDYATSYTTYLTKDYATFQPVWNTYSGKDMITSLTQFGQDQNTGTQNVGSSASAQTIFFNGQFDYKRTFADVHNVNATLLATGWQKSTAGQYHRTSSVNMGLLASYNYAKKYYADLSLTALHSAKLAEGHRLGWSPTATFAWRIDREDFMKDVQWINRLRLSASASNIKQDIDLKDGSTEYYLYANIFTAGGNWWGWNDGISKQASQSQRGGNPDLTYIQRKEYTIGIDGRIFDLVDFNINYFNTTTDGLITRPSTILPNYFRPGRPSSDFLPYMNYNAYRRTGLDFSLSAEKKFGEWTVGAGVGGMITSAKHTKYNENVEYDYQKTEGADYSALRGLKSQGLFQSQEEIDNWTNANGDIIKSSFISDLKPGDIKYVDMNNDGIIDSKDEVVLGSWAADATLGINFTVKYKGLTLFAVMSGSFGGQALKSNSYMWCGHGENKYSEVVRNRWTPETAATATYPRLSSDNNSHNFRSSDFWMYNTDRFDLEKVQLTYDFPSSLVQGKLVKALQLYLNGTSLLTFAGERKYMETAVGSAPQTRHFNLGVKVEF